MMKSEMITVISPSGIWHMLYRDPVGALCYGCSSGAFSVFSSSSEGFAVRWFTETFSAQ